MKKIIRTANIIILEIAILGGQVSYLGDHSEEDHSFTKYNDHLRKNDKSFDIELIKKHIEFYIDEYGNRPFFYYDEYYKFKIPTGKNLQILANRILKMLQEIDSWGEDYKNG